VSPSRTWPASSALSSRQEGELRRQLLVIAVRGQLPASLRVEKGQLVVLPGGGEAHAVEVRRAEEGVQVVRVEGQRPGVGQPGVVEAPEGGERGGALAVRGRVVGAAGHRLRRAGERLLPVLGLVGGPGGVQGGGPARLAHRQGLHQRRPGRVVDGCGGRPRVGGGRLRRLLLLAAAEEAQGQKEGEVDSHGARSSVAAGESFPPVGERRAMGW